MEHCNQRCPRKTANRWPFGQPNLGAATTVQATATHSATTSNLTNSAARPFRECWTADPAGRSTSYKVASSRLARFVAPQGKGESRGQGRHVQLAWRTVGSIITRVWADTGGAVDRLEGLSRIGIDEISYRRGQQYLTVVVDHDSGRLVWAAPGNSAATLRSFFDALGQARSAGITHVSADGRTGSRSSSLSGFPTRWSARTRSMPSSGPPPRWTRSGSRRGGPPAPRPQERSRNVVGEHRARTPHLGRPEGSGDIRTDQLASTVRSRRARRLCCRSLVLPARDAGRVMMGGMLGTSGGRRPVVVRRRVRPCLEGDVHARARPDR